jgi:hypothetical protein
MRDRFMNGLTVDLHLLCRLESSAYLQRQLAKYPILDSCQPKGMMRK